MPSASTTELNEVIEQAENSAMIEPEIFASLARQLQLAVSTNGEELPDLATKLARLLKITVAHIPPEAMDDLDSESLTSLNTAIFTAGQLSFAHQLASDALNQISERALTSIIEEPRYRIYLLALAEAPLSGIQLAQKCKQRPETVSRNIGELREIGLVEYRRQGTAFVNFLTPIGRALLQLPRHEAESKPTSSSRNSGYNTLLNATRPNYRSFPVFGNETHRAA